MTIDAHDYSSMAHSSCIYWRYCFLGVTRNKEKRKFFGDKLLQSYISRCIFSSPGWYILRWDRNNAKIKPSFQQYLLLKIQAQKGKEIQRKNHLQLDSWRVEEAWWFITLPLLQLISCNVVSGYLYIKVGSWIWITDYLQSSAGFFF